MVRPTFFWDGPRGLRYHITTHSLPPPFHTAPQLSSLTSAWGAREETVTLGSLSFRLYLLETN